MTKSQLENVNAYLDKYCFPGIAVILYVVCFLHIFLPGFDKHITMPLEDFVRGFASPVIIKNIEDLKLFDGVSHVPYVFILVFGGPVIALHLVGGVLLAGWGNYVKSLMDLPLAELRLARIAFAIPFMVGAGFVPFIMELGSSDGGLSGRAAIFTWYTSPMLYGVIDVFLLYTFKASIVLFYRIYAND